MIKFFVSTALLLALPHLSFCDSIPSRDFLSGTIYDEINDAVVSKVTVEYISPTGHKFSTTSDDRGYFELRGDETEKLSLFPSQIITLRYYKDNTCYNECVIDYTIPRMNEIIKLKINTSNVLVFTGEVLDKTDSSIIEGVIITCDGSSEQSKTRNIDGTFQFCLKDKTRTSIKLYFVADGYKKFDKKINIPQGNNYITIDKIYLERKNTSKPKSPKPETSGSDDTGTIDTSEIKITNTASLPGVIILNEKPLYNAPYRSPHVVDMFNKIFNLLVKFSATTAADKLSKAEGVFDKVYSLTAAPQKTNINLICEVFEDDKSYFFLNHPVSYNLLLGYACYFMAYDSSFVSNDSVDFTLCLKASKHFQVAKDHYNKISTKNKTKGEYSNELKLLKEIMPNGMAQVKVLLFDNLITLTSQCDEAKDLKTINPFYINFCNSIDDINTNIINLNNKIMSDSILLETKTNNFRNAIYASLKDVGFDRPERHISILGRPDSTVIKADYKAMKKIKMIRKGMDLGHYHNPEADSSIRIILMICNDSIPDFLAPHVSLRVRILGEADGHPYKNKSFYQNDYGPSYQDSLLLIPIDDTKDIKQLIEDFSMEIHPNTILPIKTGDIMNNEKLAFARAFLRSRDIRLYKPNASIKLIAKHNKYKGKDYRGVYCIFLIENGYKKIREEIHRNKELAASYIANRNAIIDKMLSEGVNCENIKNLN